MASEQRWPAGGALTHEDLLGELLTWTDAHLGGDGLKAVGHRIVHGGAVFTAPVRLDESVTGQAGGADAAGAAAPAAQSGRRARGGQGPPRRLPRSPVSTPPSTTAMRRRSTRFAPAAGAARTRGVRRYGFHGLSYEYIAGRLRALDPALAAGRVIVAHLGNGASLCAIQAGAARHHHGLHPARRPGDGHPLRRARSRA